jgi:hypothetical protein
MRVDLTSNFDDASFYMDLSDDGQSDYTVSFFHKESGLCVDLDKDQTQSFFDLVRAMEEAFQATVEAKDDEED